MPCPGGVSGLKDVGSFGCLIDVCPALVVVFLSSFPPHSFFLLSFFGGLAQLGERQDRTLKVRGSNPLPSTNLDDSKVGLCHICTIG